VTILRLTFPFDPVPKERARTSVLDQHGRPRGTATTFTPERTRLYEWELSLRARAELSRQRLPKPLVAAPGPVFVAVTFHLAGPKRNREDFPVGRPDVDNLLKSLLDGLRGVLWADDCQVVAAQASKVWAVPPAGPRTVMVVADRQSTDELRRSERESGAPGGWPPSGSECASPVGSQ